MAQRLGLAWLLACCFVPSTSAMADAPAVSDEQIVSAGTQQDLLVALAPWVESHVGVQLGVQRGAVQVDALGVWSGAKTTEATDLWRVKWRPAAKRHDGWLVTLDVVAASGGPVSMQMRFVARERQAVWRARAPLNAGDAVDCASLSHDMRLKQPGTRVWQGQCEGLVGLVVRRPVASGEVLVEGDLGPPPAVQRQQMVEVWSRSNGVEISTAAQVLADARVGQRVPVRIAGSSSVLQATVMSSSQLQIVEGAK